MPETTEAVRKKIGRPAKSDEGPRVAQSTRVRPSIAAKLAREAERSGRSIGEEIEYRLTQSFESIYLPPINAETRRRLIEDATRDGKSESYVLKQWAEGHVQRRDYEDDDRTIVLLRMVQNACFTVETMGGERWNQDPLAAAAVLATIIRSLGSLMPRETFDEGERALIEVVSQAAVRQEHEAAVSFIDPGVDEVVLQIFEAWQVALARRRQPAET